MTKIHQKQSDKPKPTPSAQSPEPLESLRDEIQSLNKRINVLESLLTAKASPDPAAAPVIKPEEISSELIVVIGAVIAAYLGVEPHIRQIRLLNNHPWGQQGRVTIQASHRIRVGHG